MPRLAADPGHVGRVRRLEELLAGLRGLAVAFSGGVDSAVLLHAATRVLGDRAVGVIADSPSLPRGELAQACAFAARIGARLEIVRTDELDDPRYRANAGDRCYFCKEALFRALESVAHKLELGQLAFGEIEDDLLDDRPGSRSARERGVLAPLRAAGFSKRDVRRYARERDLAVALKPASACLASRLPVGTEVTRERLARVEEAEGALRALGFRVLRVRDHGPRARVEVGADELARATALADELAAALEPHGFATFELAAYRSPTAL